jgi:esterase/lipase superfamily enzyme
MPQYVLKTKDRALVMVPGGGFGPASAAPLVFHTADAASRIAANSGRNDLVVDLVQNYADAVAP